MAAKTVTLGGKGSSLSPSSLFSISHGLSRLSIDASTLDKLTSSSPSSCAPIKYKFVFPDYLNPIQIRASLTVLLNQLLLSRCASKPLATKIVELLNNGNAASADSLLEEVDVSKDELKVIENSCSELIGICGVLDYGVTCLSGVCDAVAALSCEATKSNISVFNVIDAGDGLVVKDKVGVAGDMKVLLTGSNSVGNLENEHVSVIPDVHGSVREVAKSVHSRMRIELNSGVGVAKVGTEKVVQTLALAMASALYNLGESSLGRAILNLDSCSNSENLRAMFNEKCPGLDDLRSSYKLILDTVYDRNYIKILSKVNKLLDSIREIITWEAITAFASLEGESLGRAQDAEADGEKEKVEKKGDKKKKKVVFGKGTTKITELIKDKLRVLNIDSVDGKLVQAFYALLDPKDLEFNDLLEKLKKIVESNESRRLPKLAKGTRDFANEQMAIREKAFSIITDVFKRHGATALDTPAFELRETLMGKYGEDSKLVYDLADQGGELCSLRYDLTVPFARFVAMNGLTSFKRYQIAKVYRRDNPSKGRYREFYQCDFDIAGQYETMLPDAEIIKVLTELLDELEIGEYEIKLNHRKLLDGMFEICGVPAEKFRTICSSVDKLDKQSFDQIKKEMVEEKGLTVENADKIGSFVKERGPPLVILSKLKEEGSEFMGNDGSKIALEELEKLFKYLEKSKCISKVVFDLSLARGLDYYTGLIFEAVFKGTMQVGSIAAGGRYDNLAGMFGTKQVPAVLSGMFGTKQVPAVGVSLGIERVFTIMEQQLQKQAIRANETQVLISSMVQSASLSTDQAAQLGFELASELWDAKIKAEYFINKRFDKQLERAKDKTTGLVKIPWMVLIGNREHENGVVKIKNVEANKEYDMIPRSRFVEELQILMKEASN